jgi:multiple sugar transport system substrate-binding protein
VVILVRKRIFIGFVIGSLVITTAACGGQTKVETKEEAVIKNDPVTVKLAANKGFMSDEELSQFAAAVTKKYPHISIQRTDTAVAGSKVPELVASGNIPDLILEAPLNILEFKSLGLYYNMEELIKKHKFDLARIQPEYLESIKVGSFSEQLVGLPVYNNGFGLFYNKDLFDRFGVSYPKDGMTWEEIRSLAVKLTRNDNGVTYVGLHPNSVFWGAYQLGLPFIDTVNDKSVFQSQGWKDLFQFWHRLQQLSDDGVNPKGIAAIKGFQDGQVAMTMGYSALLPSMVKIKGLNWDVVTYPVNPAVPGVGQRVDSYNLVMTAQSKNKDAAFQIIEVLLSDEVQTMISRNGKVSVLKDRKIQDQFGQNNTDYQNKNVVALTKPKLAIVKPFKFSFPQNPASMIDQAFNEVLNSGKDINTALREAEEKMNAAIQVILKK